MTEQVVSESAVAEELPRGLRMLPPDRVRVVRPPADRKAWSDALFEKAAGAMSNGSWAGRVKAAAGGKLSGGGKPGGCGNMRAVVRVAVADGAETRFESITAAALASGVTTVGIARHCAGKMKGAPRGKYRFRYAEAAR